MELAKQVIDRFKSLLRSGYSLNNQTSFGKDSTCTLLLLLEAVRQMKVDGEHIPQCYVSTVDTRRDMPQMQQYVMGATVQLELFIAKHELPIKVIVIQPPLSGRFSWTCIGRGKLPRYPGQSRDCAVNEKISPSIKSMKKIENETNGKIISILGSRSDESAVRASNLNKFQMDELTISIVDGMRTFAPIADWDLDDVWDLLIACRTTNSKPPLFENFMVGLLDELMEIGRASCRERVYAPV